MQDEAQPQNPIVPVLTASKPSPYNLTKILKNHEKSKSATLSIHDIHKEIKTIKTELNQLQDRQEQHQINV